MFAGDDHIDEKVYIESTRILKEKFGVDTIYVKRNDMSSSKLRKCAYKKSLLKNFLRGNYFE